MPKNPNLNIARYKVAGGELNPFEFHQNQQALVEQQQHEADNLIPGTPPEMKSQTEEGRLGAAAAPAETTSSTKTRSKLPPKTRRQAGTKKAASKKSVSQKGREKKSTKKSAKKTKPAKRSTASKGRPAKKAAKRSTKKAAKKTGTKKKARK